MGWWRIVPHVSIWAFMIVLYASHGYSTVPKQGKYRQKKRMRTQRSRPIMIRVLLKEVDMRKKQKLTIASFDKHLFFSTRAASKKKSCFRKSQVDLITNNNVLYLKWYDKRYHKVLHTSLFISFPSGMFSLDGTPYKGTLMVHRNRETRKLEVINTVALSDYLYSVLRYESLSFWPLEMQKVQAVASRTYAIYQMKQARKNKNKKNGYDIKNTNIHQVYNGNHSCTHLQQAVCETKNQVLTHNKNVALTMFDISCGGIVPSHMKLYKKNKPYLFRSYRCLFCKDKQFAQWQEKMSIEQFVQQLCNNPNIGHHVKKLNTLVGIRVNEKDNAGIAQSIMLAGKRKNVVVSALELKESLDPMLKSLAFDVKKMGNTIILEGQGYGHNMGLCQLGARELVARGWNYEKILRFYYPYTELRCLREQKLVSK